MPFALLEEAVDRAILGLDAPGDSTLILMVEALPGDMRADELAGAGLEALARGLGAFRLIDRAPAEIGGERGVRTTRRSKACSPRSCPDTERGYP